MAASPNPGTNPAAPLPAGVARLAILADQPLLGEPTNCYAIATPLGWLLVDPPSQRPEALAALEALGPLRALLITHTHADHIGGVAALVARHALPILAHPLAEATLALPVQPLREGDEVAGWRVLETPGHRADSLSFLRPTDSSAIVGDLVSGAGTVVIIPPDGDLSDYLASLHRLRDELRPACLLPGHGPQVTEPAALLSHTIAHRLGREQRVLAALSDAPATLEALLPLAYSDTDPALYPLARHSLLAHLLKLEREQRARSEAGRWRRG